MPSKQINSTISAFRVCPFTSEPCTFPCDNLVTAKCEANMSDNEVIKELDVSQNTWRRYRNGTTKPPRSVCLYLHIRSGNLPWSSMFNCFFNFREEKLYIDNMNLGLSLSDLRVYWWKLQMIPALQRRVKEQQKSIDELSWYAEKVIVL